MKVLATSDLHGHLPEVPECDILVLAGDVCPDFRGYGRNAGYHDRSGQKQGRWLDTVFRDWLDSVPAKHVISIAGNHDFVFEHPFLVPRGLRWTYLQDSGVELDGIWFWGTPWVPGLPYWAFYGRNEALEARAAAIPEGVDVLVTHGPPLGHGDFIPTSPKQRNKYGNYGGVNAGEPYLNAAIKRIRPWAVVCGHIHEDFGEHPHTYAELGVFNVAINDENYSPCRPLVELPLR